MTSNCQDEIILTTTILGSFYMFKHCNDYFVKKTFLDNFSYSSTNTELLFKLIPFFSNSFFFGISTAIIFTTFIKGSNLLYKI